MFWQVMDIMKQTIIKVGELAWYLFDQLGGAGFIITMGIISIFTSFIILGRSGSSVLGAIGEGRSDRLSYSRSEHVKTVAQQRAARQKDGQRSYNQD